MSATLIYRSAFVPEEPVMLIDASLVIGPLIGIIGGSSVTFTDVVGESTNPVALRIDILPCVRYIAGN